jgi:hypothetical protein
LTGDEFRALRPGDRVHHFDSVGHITHADDKGVMLQWRGQGPTFVISVHSTIWMHWSKIDDAENS